MKRRGLVLVLLLCLANAGCSLFLVNSVRNLTQFPVYQTDNIFIRCRNRELAAEGWRAWHKDHAEKKYSRDFAYGFEEGYWDHLENGGTGCPPAIPPFCYRLMAYQTPQGIRAVEDWYEGFRLGALEAMASGLREQFVLPLGDQPITAGRDYSSLNNPRSSTDGKAEDKTPTESKPPMEEKPPMDQKLPPPRLDPPPKPEPQLPAPRLNPPPKPELLPAVEALVPPWVPVVNITSIYAAEPLPGAGTPLPPLAPAGAR